MSRPNTSKSGKQKRILLNLTRASQRSLYHPARNAADRDQEQTTIEEQPGRDKDEGGGGGGGAWGWTCVGGCMWMCIVMHDDM